ncbi:MAG: type I restriction endonuclease [Bacillota bacterium]|nr:type I restriction endonuclease [Bacillota bacterium]
MGFKEDLQKLSIQIIERKVHISNEEMTKQALIIPFLQVLGFDVFNPLEVRPEFIADFGKKKGEKVDYALFKENIPVAFLEAKSVNENLSNHDAQLSRYFNAVQEVKLGILTNGIEYKFFTDLNANNIMDETPFLKLNLTSLSDADIENLSKFKKDLFDTELLVKYAEELVYTSALDNTLKELFKNPSDEFVRFLIKDFSDSRITNNVIERFRPIVKKAISNAVIDIVSKGLYQQEEVSATKNEVENNSEEMEVNNVIDTKRRVINTTQEELQSFDIINNIIKESFNLSDEVKYKDTVNYFSIYYQNTTRWFLRLQLDCVNKNITTKIPVDKVKELAKGYDIESAPKGMGESRIFINSLDDINNLRNLVVESFKIVNN